MTDITLQKDHPSPPPPPAPMDNDAPPLYKDFPWYREPHPRSSLKNKVTFPTTAQERQRHYVAMLSLAESFSKRSFETIIGIPGTKIVTQAAADATRAQLHNLVRGNWKPTQRTQLVKHVQDPLYGKCDKKHPDGPRRETQYRWVPDSGSLVTATPDQWCSVLNGRHILLVGDLVQYQLHDLFLDTLRDAPTACYGELNCKDSRLRYLRNDVLSSNRRQMQHDGHPQGDVIRWPFMASNILKAYPILILNRSPVIETDEEFIQSLTATLKAIRNVSPNTLVVYRSTPIGHPYCDDATGPMQQPLQDEDLVHLPFGWSELERRNTLAKVIVEAAGGVFVDLAALLNTRPDGHVGNHDCLRYCIPGPMDDWMDVLYQVFSTLGQSP
ncbi:hypothetical protein DM01DRAFT_1364384 [Hesseltinella vesiculosa]|uniref:Uncharacterized protein n=1 Tax=Hesseltinella vesiculosa TaxID=101127 RepID=A0A1X2G6M2_9FUNG|nr:hypothetical protein DM01DRAFT_1364384 [Hesseltinella vesiculosa]